MGSKTRKEGGGRELSYKEQRKRTIIWGIAMILGWAFAATLKFWANKETAVTICCISMVILFGCSIVLVPAILSLEKCHFFKEVFWGLLNPIIPWCAACVVLLVFPSTIVSAETGDIVLDVINSFTNISMDKDDSSQSKDSETTEQEKIALPKRTKKEFVWEEDIYVDDLSEYYEGDIAEKEEERYMRQLIREDLSHMKNGEVKDKAGFSKEYSTKTTAANSLG